MLAAAFLSVATLVLCPDCSACDTCLTVTPSETGESYRLVGSVRSTPEIAGRVLDQGTADIDLDGHPDLIVLDDRDSAAGSGIAVVYDLSAGLGRPYAFFACPLSTPNIETAISTCRETYQGISLDRSLTGLDHIRDAASSDGPMSWEARALVIPNWTDIVAATLTRFGVERARGDLQLAEAQDVDTDVASSALHAAMQEREENAVLWPTGE